MKAEKIFLYADSYATKTLLFHIDRLFNTHISTIYLLKENHKEKEEYYFSSQIHVVVLENIESIVKAVDLSIALIDKSTPNRKVNEIKDLSALYGGRCVIFDNPWSKTTSESRENVDKLLYPTNEYQKKPVILVVSISRFSEQYCIEVILNKIFTEEGVPFTQEYSRELNYIVDCLSSLDMVHCSFNKHECDEASLIIKTIEINSLIDEDFARQFLSTISPDFIILAGAIDCKQFEEIDRLFWYKYSLKTDMFIASPYIAFERFDGEINAVYCDCTKEFYSRNVLSNREANFENELRNRIFAKISMPLGVYIIQSDISDSK